MPSHPPSITITVDGTTTSNNAALPSCILTGSKRVGSNWTDEQFAWGKRLARLLTATATKRPEDYSTPGDEDGNTTLHWDPETIQTFSQGIEGLLSLLSIFTANQRSDTLLSLIQPSSEQLKEVFFRSLTAVGRAGSQGINVSLAESHSRSQKQPQLGNPTDVEGSDVEESNGENSIEESDVDAEIHSEESEFETDSQLQNEIYRPRSLKSSATLMHKARDQAIFTEILESLTEIVPQAKEFIPDNHLGKFAAELTDKVRDTFEDLKDPPSPLLMPRPARQQVSSEGEE